MKQLPLPAGVKPRGTVRVVFHADGHPRNHLPLDPEAHDLHEYVDHLADAEIDVFSLLCFVSGQALWQSELAIPMASKWPVDSPHRVRLGRLRAKGVDPVEVYAKRCHEKGLKFLAKFRMNDRHSRGHLSGHFNCHMGKFIEDHQEWWLKSYPGGLDFSFQGVRDWYAALVREVIGKFDIDGVTFNYLRYPYVFEPSDSRAKQPILTEFMREVRGTLDEEGRRKGRKLLLCAVVPVTLQECHELGCDVPTWVGDGLVDILCPCDYNSAVLNAPYHEFGSLTRDTDGVYLMPAVQAHLSRTLYTRNLMSLPAYRALVSNFYAAGADGISAFNFMYHWARMQGLSYSGNMDQFPAALHCFRELRAPEQLTQGDRHYAWWPDSDCSAVFPGLLDRSRMMTFQRDLDSGAEWTIRCAERFAPSQDALVRMNIVNLLPGDEIEVSVNGEAIPADAMAAEFHADGRREYEKGMLLPPYASVTFRAASPPFVCGENTLAVRLLKSGPGTWAWSLFCREFTVAEIEIGVSAGVTPVLEVMDSMQERHSPPVASLAGYHPDPKKAYLDAYLDERLRQPVGAPEMIGDKQVTTKGAQSFVLEDSNTMEQVDLCVCSTPDVQTPMRLSVHEDAGGVPAETPVHAAAVTAFDPWVDTEGLSPATLSGYYRFRFEPPLALGKGTYWLVFDMDPSGQPRESDGYADTGKPEPSCYGILLASTAVAQYPQGRYLSREKGKWQEITRLGKPLAAFFGVFDEATRPQV